MSDDEKTTFGRYLGYASGILGILVVLVPAAIWLAKQLHSETPGPTGPTIANSATTNSGNNQDTATGVGQTTSGQRVLLDSLTPDKGAQFFGGLPHALADNTAYAHAVTLPCPTNNVGDKSHVVTYLLGGRYLSLHVQLQPYRATSDESQVQYKFFADNADPQQAVLDVNSGQSLDIDLEGAQKLSIEIACQPPGSLAILTDAYLTHT